MKSIKRLFTMKIPCSILAVTAALCLGSTRTTAIAQTLVQAPAADTTAGPGVSPAARVDTPSNQNAEILKELQEMRARIQQLEAQLRARSGTNGTQSAALQ